MLRIVHGASPDADTDAATVADTDAGTVADTGSGTVADTDPDPAKRIPQ